MIAGPIVRFNQIADQIENREALESIDNKLLGLFRFAIEFSKKSADSQCFGSRSG
jgi:alginate O-acetyltransferase complex protein AlgI